LREKLTDLERMTEAERRQLSERIDDMRGERDRLLKVIEEQAGSFRQLTDQRQQQQPQPKGLRGFLHRLAG
jgi:septal ring factor EnvC (AmiA/AmiB activator)